MSNKYPFPTSVTFEITSRCNFRCSMCYYSEEHLGAKLDFLSLKQIQHCIEKLPTTVERAYLIGGEPLIRKDIVEIVKVFEQRGVHVSIITNGYLLTEALIQQFRDAGVRPTFEISLDGPPEVHDRIRGKVGAFERVMDNVQKLDSDFEVVFVSVLQRSNEDSLVELPRYIEGRKGCLHVVQVAREWSEIDAKETMDELHGTQAVSVRQDAKVSPVQSRNILLAKLHEIEAAGRRHGICTVLKPQHLFDTLPLLFCQDGRKHLSNFSCNQAPGVRIDPEGNVIFCYALRAPLGNLLRDSFEDIWNDAPNLRIRSMIDADLPRLCAQCTAHLDYHPPVVSSRLKVGIIGTGRIAGVYADVLKSMSDVDLVGIAGSAERAAELAGQKKTRTMSTEQLGFEADAVIVAGKPGQRFSQVRNLENIPLLVEKPLAGSLEGCGKLIALDDRSPFVPRQNVFPLRHTDWAWKLENFAKSADGGKPCRGGVYRVMPVPDAYYAERDWRRSPCGSPIWNMLIHELDLVLSWFGIPDWVDCVGRSVQHDVAYDTAFARLGFADGFCVEAAVSTAPEIARQGRSILIQKETKSLHYIKDILIERSGLGAKLACDAPLDRTRDPAEFVSELGRAMGAMEENGCHVGGPYNDEEKRLCSMVVEDWTRRIRLQHAPNPTLLDGALRVQVCEACHRSMESGTVVDLSELSFDVKGEA